MRRLVDILLGKYRITLKDASMTEITSFLLKRKLSASVTPDKIITVSESGYKSFLGEFGDRVVLLGSVFGMKGLRGFFKHRIASISCFVILSFLFFMTSGLVWDVRISGNESLTDKEIETMLSECGLDIGKRWRGIDLGLVETSVLSENGELAWVNINRRGTVAYVEIKESKSHSYNTENPQNVGNIVAERDCVIEEIVVKKGVANVSVGDVVRRGEVLISGIIETEGGTVFCHAEGVVKGKFTDSVSSESKRVETVHAGYENELSRVYINFFNFSVNIFKKYGNQSSDCDIIVEKQKIVTPYDTSLPFGITRAYASKPVYESVDRSDGELIELAFLRHRELIENMAERYDLISISTDSEFTEDGYKVISRVVYSSEVGVFDEILIE